MFNYRWIFLITLSICLFGCWEKNSSYRIQKGPLSQKELETRRGVAQNIQQTPTNQEIHQYPDNESFQVQKGQVTYYYRNPTVQEESLQHWLNNWQNDMYGSTPIGKNDSVDTSKVLYYINFDNNESFFFDKSNQKVTRVVYELDIDEE